MRKIAYVLLLVGLAYQQYSLNLLHRKIDASSFVLGRLYENELRHFYAQKYSTQLYFNEV